MNLIQKCLTALAVLVSISGSAYAQEADPAPGATQNMTIFTDNFESGDTRVWSSRRPRIHAVIEIDRCGGPHTVYSDRFPAKLMTYMGTGCHYQLIGRLDSFQEIDVAFKDANGEWFVTDTLKVNGTLIRFTQHDPLRQKFMLAENGAVIFGSECENFEHCVEIITPRWEGDSTAPYSIQINEKGGGYSVTLPTTYDATIGFFRAVYYHPDPRHLGQPIEIGIFQGSAANWKIWPGFTKIEHRPYVGKQLTCDQTNDGRAFFIGTLTPQGLVNETGNCYEAYFE